jgi:Transposase
MTYQTLFEQLDFSVDAETIKRALHKRGYHRRVTLRKPFISEVNRVIRLT